MSPLVKLITDKLDVRSRQIARLMLIGSARARKISETRPIFQVRTFCFLKNKKPLDLQVFSRIGKTMKKLQLSLNTIMNTSLLVIF